MIVEKLIEELKKYPPKAQVMFTLEGAENMYWADRIYEQRGTPIITCEDGATYGDIVGMAKELTAGDLTVEQMWAIDELIKAGKEKESPEITEREPMRVFLDGDVKHI